MMKELVKSNRSFRRFKEEIDISIDVMYDCIDNARLSPSARNAQSMKFYVSNDRKINDLIFPELAWAGFIKGWEGPAQGERPSAYVIILNDLRIADKYYCDDGIAAQTIMLSMAEKGFGGCIIGSVNRNALREKLNISGYFDILYVLALGKPAETVVIEDMDKNGDYKYWRDEEGIHHVPKRSLNNLIINS
jgi:nitroreductase